MPLLSIVIPAHNERDVLPALEQRLSALMGTLALETEVVIVDDGSTDGSVELERALVDRDPRFKLVELSRNFGHQAAVTAGLDVAQGDAVVVMDADLQDPPELVPEMVEHWLAGSHVVYGVRDERTADSTVKRATARGYYRLLNRLTQIDVPLDAGDFRLLDRRVLDALDHLREDDRYLRGMVAWLGFKQTEVRYRRPERAAGEPKYTLRKSFRLAVDGVVGFSEAPLHMATKLGFLFSGVAALAGLFAVVQKVLGADLVPGWASILVVVSLIGGVQLLVLGVLGTYLGRVYGEVKRRPLYVASALHGIEPPRRAPERAVLPRSAEPVRPAGPGIPGERPLAEPVPLETEARVIEATHTRGTT